MSYDLAIWFPKEVLTDKQPLDQYHKLCNGDTSGLIPHPSIGEFYLELYCIHPEIDDIPEEKQGNFDFSPWSIEHDFSDRHLIVCSVWSHADYVHDLVLNLAKKYGLTMFDPQLKKFIPQLIKINNH